MGPYKVKKKINKKVLKTYNLLYVQTIRQMCHSVNAVNKFLSIPIPRYVMDCI